MQTFKTKYGDITCYSNETYITKKFKEGLYWDEDTLLQLKKYINPQKNILEIGGHCGTSTIVYSSFLTSGKCYVFEPQKNLYNLLVHNIEKNRLSDKIIPFNKGVFCYTGKGNMNNIDLDGGGGIVEKRYTTEKELQCNFGGITLGIKGEVIDLITIDDMNIDNIGFIHCDAQGSENFLFSSALKTISRDKPVIFYEDNFNNCRYLYDSVKDNYPQFKNESVFDLKSYCINVLGYKTCIEKFNGGADNLLIP
jgi:FkbM family methyltransferase